jgi:hypothetical protein
LKRRHGKENATGPRKSDNHYYIRQMNVFENVKRFPFLLTTADCPLSFNAKLVYSYLAYRHRKHFASTACRIAGDTGLDRRKSVPQALADLAGHGLAVKKPAGWFAREPEGKVAGWFQVRADASARMYVYYDRLRYQMHPMPGPKCPLTPRQVYLYGLMVSLLGQKKRMIADKYLQKLSGLDLATVRSGRRRLFETGLLVDAPGGWLATPADRTPGWFLPINLEEGSGQFPIDVTSTDHPIASTATVPITSPEAAGILGLTRLLESKVEKGCNHSIYLMRQYSHDVLRQVAEQIGQPIPLKAFQEMCQALVPAPVVVQKELTEEDDLLARLDALDQEATEQVRPLRTRVTVHEETGDSLMPKALADDLHYTRKAPEDIAMLRPALVAALVAGEYEEQDADEEIFED